MRILTRKYVGVQKINPKKRYVIKYGYTTGASKAGYQSENHFDITYYQSLNILIISFYMFTKTLTIKQNSISGVQYAQNQILL